MMVLESVFSKVQNREDTFVCTERERDWDCKGLVWAADGLASLKSLGGAWGLEKGLAVSGKLHLKDPLLGGKIPEQPILITSLQRGWCKHRAFSIIPGGKCDGRRCPVCLGQAGQLIGLLSQSWRQKALVKFQRHRWHQILFKALCPGTPGWHQRDQIGDHILTVSPHKW